MVFGEFRANMARSALRRLKMTLEALGWNSRRQEEFQAHAAQGLVPGRVVGEHRSHYRVATDTTELSAGQQAGCAILPKSAQICPASATS